MSKYWFRKREGLQSKDRGYGWVPITWQGWLVVSFLLVFILIATILFAVFESEINSLTGSETLSGVLLLGLVLVVTAVAGFISYKKARP